MGAEMLAAQVVIGAAVLALGALAAVHVLKPDIHSSSTMISQYALGRFGWVMALCFAAFAAASAGLFVALVAHASTLLSRIGLVLLLIAAVGLAMAAAFPMDPVSTPPDRMSFSGKMHGVSFLLGVPCQLLAPLLLSLAVGNPPHPSPTLLALTSVIWLSFSIMLAIMLKVGPGKAPNPDGPERFLGLPNRLFMIAFGLWLVAAAWPTVR